VKLDHSHFVDFLKSNNITQKAFSKYAKISYDTVTGWKKKGRVPLYAMVIAKDMIFRKRYDATSVSLQNTTYLTSIQALNYHHYDWHKGAVDYNRQYPSEVREWSDWGIDNFVANPIRAYLDYLYYNIKFQRRVPNMKIDMFLFDDKEVKEIEEKIQTLLKPVLEDGEEMDLLEQFIKYQKGGEYDFRSKSYAKRKAFRERLKAC
jgi:transcriptional regulator with XRE-family HTH domain